MKLGYCYITFTIFTLFVFNSAENFINNEVVIDLFQTRMLESSINETIEGLKEKLKNGDPALGLPSFDPLQIKHLPLKLDSDFIATDLTIENLFVSGIPDFVASYLQFKMAAGGFSLKFTVELNKIVLQTNYDGDISLFNFINLFGKGIIGMEIVDIVIEGSTKIRTPDGFIQLGELNLILSIGGFKFDISGLLNDEEISQEVTDQLTIIVPELLAEKQEWLTETLSPLLESLVNSQIGGVQLCTVLGNCPGK